MSGKHFRGMSGEKPYVETYQLPRWDANGRRVDGPAAHKSSQQSETEDVNPETLAPPTAADIQRIHEDAYNEGFESGFEQGMKQGQATGQAEGYRAGYESGEEEGRNAGTQAGKLAAEEQEAGRIREELAPLAGLLEEAKQILPQQRRDLEAGIVALVTRIARNVIDAELALNPGHISDLVHAAVQALPNADERFTLEINPEDAAYLEQVAEPHWNIVPVPSVSRGGCLIRTRFSYVDYSQEHRYRQQVSNLLAHVGLDEQLTEMEKPWPLPPADDALAQSDEPKEPEDAGGAIAEEPGQDDETPAPENTDLAVEITKEPESETALEDGPPEPAEVADDQGELDSGSVTQVDEPGGADLNNDSQEPYQETNDER